MNKKIVLDSTNYVEGTGNQYEYEFSMEQDTTNWKVAVGKVQIFNCVYNISSSIGNNTYKIKWLGQEYSNTIRDGYYSVSDLNTEIQAMMVKNKLYTIPSTSTSQYTVYLALYTDDTGYGVSFTNSLIPTTNTGLSLPSGATWSLPSVSEAPQIKLCDGLCDLLGFSSSYYNTYFPNSTSATIVYSDGTTEIQYIDSYSITCNLINHGGFSKNTHIDVLHSVALDVSYGSMIVDKPHPFFIDCVSMRTKKIIIKIKDQKGNNINLKDKALSIELYIEIPKNNKI